MNKKEENIYREKMIPEGFKDHLKIEEGEKIINNRWKKLKARGKRENRTVYPRTRVHR